MEKVDELSGWNPFALWSHKPRYHHGISKKEHIKQSTGNWFLAYYGTDYMRYNRMTCYGRPSGWEWSIKDRVDGPRSRNYKRLLRRNMRKRARREAKQFIREVQQDAQETEDTDKA